MKVCDPDAFQETIGYELNLAQLCKQFDKQVQNKNVDQNY